MGFAEHAVVDVIGGGLAGSEAAWQLAERGHDVRLHEMRPVRSTPAHRTGFLGELVCSNTFKSTECSNAHGLLKAEMRRLGSIVLWAADQARVPGGTALTVDRERFAAALEQRVAAHPRITIVREEVVELPAPGIVATGPLTSDALTDAIQRRLGISALAFYDAIAPIVAGDSIDRSIVFRASRWGKETMPGLGTRDSALGARDSAAPRRAGANAPAVATPSSTDRSRGAGPAPVIPSDARDPHPIGHSGHGESEEGAYLNCPFTKEQYEAFLDALGAADQYSGKAFDPIPYFEGCMPVEEMAKRGRESLRFGPMKPVGLVDPRTGRRPYAVAQLRMEDREGRMWNLVGFQTRMRTGEQQRVLRLVPGLEHAEFLRWGSIHRNSYINAPAALSPALSLRDQPLTLFAGQLTGVEGYTESTATGLLAGINLARLLDGDEPVLPPPTTMLGALYRYLREADPRHFQPMNANVGLLEDLPVPVRDKREKRERLAERALSELERWRDAHALGAGGVVR